MIKEIHLSNWKSFRDATLFFDPLTILIGTNASGKSNALDAIDFLSRIAESKDLTSCLQTDGNGDAFRGGIDWVALRGRDTFSLSVVAAGEDLHTDYRYEITVNPVPRPMVTQEKLTRIKRRPRSKQTLGPEMVTSNPVLHPTQILHRKSPANPTTNNRRRMTQYRILKPGEIAVPGDEYKHRGHWWRVNNEFTIQKKHLPIRRPASPGLPI